MPVSGSRVITQAAVIYGAASKPGVEIGNGSDSNPLPAPSKSLPSKIISWHGAADRSTIIGSIGFAIAFCHAGPMSSIFETFIPIR